MISRTSTGIFSSFFIAVFIFASTPAEAKKCPKGYYKNGFPPVCLPKGGKVVETLNPVNQIGKQVNTGLKLGGAIVQGNVKNIVQATGKLITNTQCVLCETVAKGNFSDKDVQLAEELIGRGFLFYATGEPLFLVVDLDTESATQHTARPQPSTDQQPQKPARDQRFFALAGASCIIKEIKSGQITVGWSSAPTGKDIKSNAQVTYPDFELWPGDTISVSAPECPKQALKDVQSSITQTQFTYQWSNILPSAGPVRMKYLLGGKAI